jgi:hypothetical protein
MRYFLLFIVLISFSCKVRTPAKYKYVSVTLVEIIEEKRWVNGTPYHFLWYKYTGENVEEMWLPHPIDNNKTIGSTHFYYVRQ